MLWPDTLSAKSLYYDFNLIFCACQEGNILKTKEHCMQSAKCAKLLTNNAQRAGFLPSDVVKCTYKYHNRYHDWESEVQFMKFDMKLKDKKFTDALKNFGDAAAEAAKNAGGIAQDIARAAQDKASFLKEINDLKAAIRNQKAAITTDRGRIADAVIAQVAAGKPELPDEVANLVANINAAQEQIKLLENNIEDLKAAAAVKNPEMEREINKAIAEIDKEDAIDVEPLAEDVAEEAEESKAE